MVHESVENFRVDTIEIGGISAAVIALHLPFKGESKSEIRRAYYYPRWTKDSPKGKIYKFSFDTSGDIVEKDMQLITTLAKRGDEHAKVLRGVTVWCEINAPRYWWQEMDRYSVGACCLSSESTMHIQGKGLQEDELVEMKENLPEGTMQRRVWMFSYQTLRRIYKQRHNHRLPQWRMFCKWIEELPYAKEFILAGLEEQSN